MIDSVSKSTTIFSSHVLRVFMVFLGQYNFFGICVGEYNHKPRREKYVELEKDQIPVELKKQKK